LISQKTVTPCSNYRSQENVQASGHHSSTAAYMKWLRQCFDYDLMLVRRPLYL